MAFGNSMQQQEMMSEINVTPLVDVMLVLLVVFIVTAPLLVPQSLKINLPKTAAVPTESRPVPTRLTVDAEGRIELDGRMLDDVRLAAILQQRAAETGFQLQVDADQAVPYRRVAELMALAQKAGVAKLSFVTLAGK